MHMNKKYIAPLLIFILVLVGAVVIYRGGAMTGEDKSMTKEDVSAPTLSAQNQTASYIDYSQENFANAIGKKRVYFFHAKWCPTCKAANEEFLSRASEIPADVVLFKTDYDTERELKKKYTITYQHTFVLVDENGNELKKWNGGSFSELIANTK